MTTRGGTQSTALVLLIASLFLLARTPSNPLTRSDIPVLSGFMIYPTAVAMNMAVHGEWLWNYFDNPSRFIAAIPIYIALRKVKPGPIWFHAGIILGALGAGFVAVSEKLAYGPEFRAHGLFHPIVFGDMAMTLGVLSLLTWRSFKPWPILWALPVIGFISGVLASLASGSRGGWIAIPFTLYIISTSLKQNHKNLKLTAWFVVIIIAMLTYHKSGFVQNRITSAITETTSYFSSKDSELGSVGIRLELWKSSFAFASDAPFFGQGVRTMEEKLPDLIANGKIKQIPPFDHLHSDFFDTLAKQGIVGIVFLALFYWTMLRICYTHSMAYKYSQHGDISLMGIVLLACFIDFGLTAPMFGHVDTTSMLAFFLAIIMAHLSNTHNNISENATKQLRP